MLIVKDLVTHLLFHVDAEAFESDPSQKPGVNVRKDQVHAMIAPFRNRNTEVTRAEYLDLLRGRAKDELLDEINAIDPDNDGERIRLVLQTWVGKGPRPGRR